MKKSTILRKRLSEESILVAPGASGALLARLVELSGFEVVYATGAGISNMQFGYPDIGLVTMSEILETVKRINDATSLPVIADIDNGYGNAMNVYRVVREFTSIGIAALQMEDQELPKRCGHFNGKRVISKEDMVNKIKAAKDASLDPDMLMIARTDAIAVNGFEDAIERAHAYVEAGADILFVEAPVDIEQMQQINKKLPGVIQIANMVEGGKTPILPNQELQDLGYKIVLYANAPLKAAIRGTNQILEYLKRNGTTGNCNHLMITMKERNQVTCLEEMNEIEKRYK